MKFKERLEKEKKYANDVLVRLGRLEEKGFQSIVLEAMNYSVFAGGKRLRPVMMKAVYDLFTAKDKTAAEDEGSINILEHFMTAIELIHTYSLVHDDLPAIDNDLYRRGRKTTHAVYGENMAVLTGDSLLNRAFELISMALLSCNDEAALKRGIKSFAMLSQKTGIYGMAGGQVYDVLAEDKGIKLDKNGLDFIFRLKTCALIEASMSIGAILGRASQDDIDLIEEAALNIGMAFQIQDDILDVTGNEEELGKPVGSDERNNKTTYVTLFGLEKSREDVNTYSKKALKIMEGFGGEDGFICELIRELAVRRY